MTRDVDRIRNLDDKLEALGRHVLLLEDRLEKLRTQVEQLTRFSANMQESLTILGVTSGYAPPGDRTADTKDFDPSVG